MANSSQARKRARQNVRRRNHNMSQRSALRTSIKKLLKLIDANNVDQARATYRETSAHIDRAASKGLHHPNRAARLKRRLNNRLRAITTQ
ncbi:MAG: 30S ribosomal protein S20 [Gammaproteobacteria bacterium]|nr:30S ribosomal protein S20 [Gammaproteobacteria bacterium]MDE0280863.1 30S ribosomal protein S20 [Gammaproteobacteria bacterium]MDE0714627.1 30S ribosomal protein S20 [Gammaproteobacteria bacterium]MXX17746.1 30S ribosomal protein S20 [Gammaproteobacteria bacterium]MXY64485.1 30S ribosomal protein S20 [Gammaproteobacteria bacterium]